MSAPLPTPSEDGDGVRTLDGSHAQPWAGQAAQDGPQLNGKWEDDVVTPAVPSRRPSSGQPGTGTEKPESTAAPPRSEQLGGVASIQQGKTSTTKKNEGPSKVQKAKDGAQKLASLSRWGLPKPAGDVKPPGVSEQGQQAKPDKKADKAAKKSVPTKAALDEPKDTAELRIVFPPDLSAVPRVDIIAIHDIDETLHKAWVYRKKPKRRVNDLRGPLASGGIRSYDGEAPLGTAGSPAPNRLRSRQSVSSSGKRKAADESNGSIERWLGQLAGSARTASGEQTVPDVNQTETPADDHGESHQTSAPTEEHDDTPFIHMLASVPEDDDATPGTEAPDDMAWRRRMMRRRPTLPIERRKLAGRSPAVVEEERVLSVGEMGDSRRANPEVLSDRQSSLDQGIEKRVNWLTDPDMLPGEIPGARVMCYTYKGVEKISEPWEYLTALAEDLIRRLVQRRTSESVDYGRVPIVLVGLGFGAVILQRAVTLLAIPSRTDANPTTDLNMLAGLVLLDAPAAGADRNDFPRSRAQEAKKTWTQDWLGRARNAAGVPTGKIDTFSMWGKFCPIASAYDIPILWHYSPMVPTPTKPAITPKNLDVLLVPKQSTTAHRLSRFEGPSDVDYKAIADSIKRSLIVQCSITKSEKLAMCLADFLRDKFPVDLRDQLGRTALHLAVRAANPDAVKRLLYQGKASVTKKDNEGRSALNIAVQEAAYRTWNSGGSPDPELQKVFTQIINLLIKSGARVDDKDNDGKTAWSYAEGESNQWLRRLKDKYLVIGSSSTMSAGVETVLQPQPGPQRGACNAYDIILAEVFLQKKRERFSEVFNFDLASVYDVIYKSTSSVPQILAASRPEQLTEDKVRCRWIHVPANNEQWVHDLMVSMRIQDGSMGGQRHEGSRLIDRYMMPQARRYKHFHSTVKKTQAEPRPRASRFGSTDSAATVVLGSQDLPPTPEEIRGRSGSKPGRPSPAPEITRTEADAIVIFMPILGFEKHRHRKYLTHAFLEANKAMQAAHARDSSPDSRARTSLKPGGFRKDDRNKAATDSSDGGESSSGRESSRLYPPVTPVARAHAQANKGREAQLLSGYLDSRQVKPVHCRRTLDQFSYYMLNSTEARDKSQVAYRWARNPSVNAEPKDRPIVMVDQLWLWAFHDGTVITSSPSTWKGQEDFNLSSVIVKELRHNKDRPVIKSVEDLLHLILKTSVDYFRRKGPAGCQFHECFQSSINNVSEQQGQLFDNFRHTTKRLHVGTLDPVQRKKEIEFLFSLDEETELLVEIMDIQDELTIVKTILTQQHDVLEKLLRLYPKKADEDAADGDDNRSIRTAGLSGGGGLGKGELMVLQNLVQLLRDQTTSPVVEARAPLSPAGPAIALREDAFLGGDNSTSQEGMPPRKRQGPMKGKEREGEPLPRQQPALAAQSSRTNILQNRDLMYETIGIVENNIRIVNDMLAYAEKVESSLENLLDLKQKHANGWEARFAREGSEESQRQGNIILVFTLVTVVFLPLSFITSFFALEIDIFPKNPETDQNLWPIGRVTAYVFGFSAVIFIPLIALALYVNKLIANVKQIYKQLVKALRDPETALNPALAVDDDSPDHDSDQERTFADRRTLAAKQLSSSGWNYGPAAWGSNSSGNKRSRHTVKRAAGSSSESESDDDGKGRRRAARYAPLFLFGRYRVTTLHTHIPLLRNLWRYRRYRVRDARRRDNRWKDTYVRDYPLRHYRAKVRVWVLRGLVSVLAWLGSEKHRRARERDRKRRGRVKRDGGTSSSCSSDSEAESSSSDGGITGGGVVGKEKAGGGQKVERRDFAMGVFGGRRKKVKPVGKGVYRGYGGEEAWSLASRQLRSGSRGGDGMEGSLEPWSNQTRSRKSVPSLGGEDDAGAVMGMEGEEKAGKRDRLGWLRMRRNLRASRAREVDEEKEIGEEGRGRGKRKAGVSVVEA